MAGRFVRFASRIAANAVKANPVARRRASNFVGLVERTVKEHNAVGFNAKHRLKDWTHPQVRAVLEAEVNGRIFDKTGLSGEILKQMSKSKDPAQMFANRMNLPVDRARSLLLKEFGKAERNCKRLQRISDTLEGQKFDKWREEANEALGHLLSPAYGRITALIGNMKREAELLKRLGA